MDVNQITKVCTICKLDKSLDEYTNRPTGKYGKRADCRQCHNERTRRWHKDNHDRSIQNVYRWKAANPDKAKAYKQKWINDNREHIARKAKERRDANKLPKDPDKCHHWEYFDNMIIEDTSLKPYHQCSRCNKVRIRHNGKYYYKTDVDVLKSCWTI